MRPWGDYELARDFKELTRLGAALGRVRAPAWPSRTTAATWRCSGPRAFPASTSTPATTTDDRARSAAAAPIRAETLGPISIWSRARVAPKRSREAWAGRAPCASSGGKGPACAESRARACSPRARTSEVIDDAPDPNRETGRDDVRRRPARRAGAELARTSRRRPPGEHRLDAPSSRSTEVARRRAERRHDARRDRAERDTPLPDSAPTSRRARAARAAGRAAAPAPAPPLPAPPVARAAAPAPPPTGAGRVARRDEVAAAGDRGPTDARRRSPQPTRRHRPTSRRRRAPPAPQSAGRSASCWSAAASSPRTSCARR